MSFVTVYTQPNCRFCTMAKSRLTIERVPFVERDISTEEAARVFFLDQGHETVPQLYVGATRFVDGGYEGLKPLTGVEMHKRLNEITNRMAFS